MLIQFNLLSQFLLKKKKLDWFFFKSKPIQIDQFWFGLVILERKPVQTDRFQFCSVWLGFFSGLSSDRFFFRLIKPKLNQTGRFFF